ncbi:MAG: hypothetical protein QNJ36_13575 [Calothrix sp. MO_167.B42]|nr:hypothetical protein [Calothrix sp. MO_167.B42]
MGKQVAVIADVQAIPGTTPYSGAANGSWTAMPVEYTSYSKLTIGGKAVIYEAECRFLFSGANSSGAPVVGQEVVTLTAQTTKLQGSLSNVLVTGDSAKGQYGNQLQVNATNKLKTA